MIIVCLYVRLYLPKTLKAPKNFKIHYITLKPFKPFKPLILPPLHSQNKKLGRPCIYVSVLEFSIKIKCVKHRC